MLIMKEVMKIILTMTYMQIKLNPLGLALKGLKPDVSGDSLLNGIKEKRLSKNNNVSIEKLPRCNQ